MPELSALAWAALVIAAVAVGVSKAALPGVNTLAVVIFAGVLPAKESTGALLVLLIVGDVLALVLHRRHARLRALVPMIPAVLAGLAVGTVFLEAVSDVVARRVIGAILLAVVALTLWRRYHAARRLPGDGGESGTAPAAASGSPWAARAVAGTYGLLGGFATMVANAAGPIMTMYFLAARFPMREFLGTAAWFFAGINLAKVPFSVGIGLITPSSLLMDAALVPAVLVGAWLGWILLRRIDQRTFERIVTVLTILGAIWLLI